MILLKVRFFCLIELILMCVWDCGHRSEEPEFPDVVNWTDPWSFLRTASIIRQSPAMTLLSPCDRSRTEFEIKFVLLTLRQQT